MQTELKPCQEKHSELQRKSELKYQPEGGDPGLGRQLARFKLSKLLHTSYSLQHRINVCTHSLSILLQI